MVEDGGSDQSYDYEDGYDYEAAAADADYANLAM